MGNNLIQFRIDEEIKLKAKEVCKEIGIDLQTYLRICTFRLVKDNGIPFALIGGIGGEIAALAMKELAIQSKRNGLSEMTMDEIDAIIAEVRREMREKEKKKEAAKKEEASGGNQSRKSE